MQQILHKEIAKLRCGEKIVFYSNSQLNSCDSFHEMGRLLLEVLFFTKSDPFCALLSNLNRFLLSRLIVCISRMSSKCHQLIQLTSRARHANSSICMLLCAVHLCIVHLFAFSSKQWHASLYC